MKKLLTLFVLLMFYINLSEQIAKLVHCGKNVKPLNDPDNTCVKVTCISSQNFASLGCPEYRCPPGKQIGVNKIDHTKVYPLCCGGPVCAN
ncbi:uncharacterized protein LOC127288073 [Leptopilina boulardi]|uniref:uncharacterized protein LOC127288073 n=1 Tax=Leptopilina boulardi TaxID=63433 RepID=UPI0021F69015|nr:uncharacterized protein LOC127288073 [Leptopilina boulardi]